MAEWAVEEDMKRKGQRRTENSRQGDEGSGKENIKGSGGRKRVDSGGEHEGSEKEDIKR